MLNWGQIVFAITTSSTLPLYLLVMLVVWRRPKLSLFHILILSQGIADVYSIFCYDFFVILRKSQLCDEFFWRHRYFLANASIIALNYSLFLRYTGITLISLQRYIIVCRHGTRYEEMMNGTPPIAYVILHWFLPVLVTVPLSTSLKGSYTRELEFDLSNDILALVNIMSVISIVISFIVCTFCYVPVLLYMVRNKAPLNRTRKNEIRLSIQVAGLVVAFLLIFIYNVGSYALVYLIETMKQTGLSDLLNDWKLLYPLANAFLCCVQPWMCTIFNTDVQKRLKYTLRCRRKKVNNSTLFVSSASGMTVAKT